MTEPGEELRDQDAEPTMKAPDEGRPDGTVADDAPAERDDEHEGGEHVGPPE
ncbi:hypothetical protein [Kribbella turkmenica]|uniref:hypothetical protein n=1 Tax=Kribbella turkmenica TaxID=2530375 RepID=UPI0014042C14|nr:hypothetical protein [Kribbella turkmenica]